MKTHHLVAGVILSATSSLAEETKQLEAHEHGVGQLNIAFSANKIAMESVSYTHLTLPTILRV